MSCFPAAQLHSASTRESTHTELPALIVTVCVDVIRTRFGAGEVERAGSPPGAGAGSPPRAGGLRAALPGAEDPLGGKGASAPPGAGGLLAAPTSAGQIPSRWAQDLMLISENAIPRSLAVSKQENKSLRKERCGFTRS